MTLRKWILALALVGLLTAAGCAGAAVAAPNDQEDSNGDAADEGPQANPGNRRGCGNRGCGRAPLLGLAVAPLGERARSGWRSPRGRAACGWLRCCPRAGQGAGVERNDVLTAVNGTTVEDPKGLHELVAALEPGAVATLTIIREGEPQDISITVGEAPARLKHRVRVRGSASGGLPGLRGLLGLVNGRHKLVDGQVRVMDGEGEIVTFTVTSGSLSRSAATRWSWRSPRVKR